jgi:hypothetical protein
MKINKLTAIGATLALAAGSIVGLGLAASAVDVPIGSIVNETSPYPVEQWFIGNPAGPALSQDTTGLTIPGRNQLLYGRSTTVPTGADFTALISGASFVATGTATFQVPVFFDGTANTEFTTLRPAVPGSPTTTSNWISSQDVPSVGLTANTPVPFTTIAAAFDTAADAEVLAFGVVVDPGTSAVLTSVTWAGTTWTFATPAAPVPPTAPPVAPPAAPVAPPATPVTGAATFTG